MEHESSNRTRPIQKRFRLSDTENEILKENMDRAGTKNFEHYARLMCLKGKIFKVELDDFREQIITINRSHAELNKIGANLNQIAKKMNSDLISADEVSQLKIEVNSELEKLKSVLQSQLEKLRNY
ncbi:MAG: MobC family plasmid mobilization relaxosome protein [Streptococcaceae bacterium]|jgi:hypothetical protein|nr:MobC family plasmid mobilization relaxosome protein [Streptococcaceae bacterium]